MKSAAELADLIERTSPKLKALHERIPTLSTELGRLISGAVNGLSDQSMLYHERYMAAHQALEFLLWVTGSRPPWQDKDGNDWTPPPEIAQILKEALEALERHKQSAS